MFWGGGGLGGAVPTHPVAAVGDLRAAGEQAVVQGDAALGHGHAVPVGVHHVEGVTVFSIWRKDNNDNKNVITAR